MKYCHIVPLLALATSAGAAYGAPPERYNIALIDPISAGQRADVEQSGVQVYTEGDDVVITNLRVSLRYHLETLRFSILDVDGEVVIDNAEALAISHLLIPAHVWPGSELYLGAWSEDTVSNALGTGRSITVTSGGKADMPTFTQTFTLFDTLDCIVSTVTVSNLTQKAMNIGAIYPIYAGAPEGILYFGANHELRILTNGAVNYLDFAEPILPGTTGTISNWSTLIYNQKTGRSLSLGYLTYNKAQPVVYNGPAHWVPQGQELQTACEYDPAKELAPGVSLTSEVMILDFTQPTPFDALETYADRVKRWLGIRTWMERHPEVGVPVGWNSWSGGGSSGGYGTNINEDVIVENMDFSDRELRRWGMNFFQIDDGWEMAIGDWQVNPDRFPNHGDQNGIEWLMWRARDLGFRSGLWIEAFDAVADSQILAEHPEYFADHLIPPPIGSTDKVLDLSNPDALAYLADLIDTVQGWGIDWLKLDFAYQAYLSTNWDDDTLTRGEFYRQGIKTVRDTLDEDVFFLNVAIAGFNYGLPDALRLTLDTMPVWEGENPKDPITNQGLKPGYRDSVRRYYLHGRTWINHPDLIFFRAHRDSEYPPLTLNESIVFESAVAFQGGLVKIGDRLVDLQPDAVDALRRIMPPYGVAGRPLDLLEREFPEVWSLPIKDFDPPYHVAGFLNWGENSDLTTLPHRTIRDSSRTLELDFAEAGLNVGTLYLGYEFWQEQFLGFYDKKLALSVPARTARAIALRPYLGRPQFLGTNRHILGGVKVIDSVRWSPAANTLTGVQEASIGTELAPFTYHLAFFVPIGVGFDGVVFDAPDDVVVEDYDYRLTTADRGSVLDIYFTLNDVDGPVQADQFGKLTWTLKFSGSAARAIPIVSP